MNYLVQLLGFLGLSASVAAFQCKKHKTIVLLRTLNELVFGLQYFFLGAYTGLAMNLIGSVRNILFTRQVEKGRSTKSTMVIFSVLFAIFGLLTWQGMKSLMIVAAKVVSTVAYGNKNPAVVRVLVLLTSIAWLVYDALIFSVAGVISEGFTVISILIGIVRLDLPHLRKRLPQNPGQSKASAK